MRISRIQKTKKKERHMKKLLSVLIVFVMVAALFGTAASALNVTADDTTKVWTGNPNIAMSFDTFYLDGVSHMDMGWGDDGGAAGKLTNNPVTVGDHQTLTLRGWAGIIGDTTITKFGYRINGGEAVYDDSFAITTEPAVINAGGDSRMAITVPIAGLTEPTLITAVAKGDDGNEYDFIEFSVNGQYGDAPANAPELLYYSADWYAYAGAILWNQGNADAVVKENPQVYELHANAASDIVGFYGWATLKDGAKIKTYGIKFDGGPTMESPLSKLVDPSLDRTAELTNAGFPDGEGFWLVFYYTDLGPGVHNAAFYAIAEDDTEVYMFDYDFTISGGQYVFNHNGDANLADPFNDTTRVGYDSPLTATVKFKTDVSFSKIMFPMVWATPHTVATIRLLSGEEEVFTGTAPEFFNAANGSGDMANVIVDFGDAIPAGQYTLEISVPEGFYAFFAYGADPLSEDYIEFERGHMIFGLYTEDEGEGFVELDAAVDPGELRIGDVNGDGKVNNKDVVALFRYVSDEEVPGFVEDAADINGDGKINNKDVVKLFKLVSQIPEEKNASLKAQSFNTVWADGALVCDTGDALGFLAENPVKGDLQSIGVRGWAWIQDGEIVQFGYKLDNGEAVFGDAFLQDRADVYAQAGATAATANGYDIENVDVSALEAGDHTITVLVKATDGTIIEVVTAPFSIERPAPVTVELLNVSYDGLYYDGALKLKEGGVDKQIILEENRPALDMQKGSVSSITIRGWARISEDTADIAGFGYSIDGGEVVRGEFIENRPDLAAAGFPGGVGFQIVASGISELDNGEHTVDAYLITKDGVEVKIVKDRSTAEATIINQVGVTFTVSEDAPPVAPAITNTCVDASSTTDGVVFARGWTGATYPISKIGYTVDDGEPVWNGEIVQLADDDPVKLPANAGQYGVRFSITAPYADLTAEDHVIKFVAQLDDEDETVLPLGPTTVWTVKGEAPLPPSVKVIVNGETTKADVVPSSVALSMDGENLVVTTDSGAGDPWFAVAVPNVAADDYASFTIKFKLNKAIASNNTYLCDGDKNFTGEPGAWVPNGMGGMEDGEWHEVTYKLSDFTYFAGKTLTYIRFTAAQSEGVMTVESVKFNKAGDEPAVVPTLAAMSFDTFFLNGQTHMELGWGDDGDAATKLAANPVSGEVNSIGGRGWAWIKDGVIEAMGYKIDDQEPVFDASYTQDRPDVRNALGGLSADVANGFNVQADTSALYDGEHTVTLVVKATDGTVINIVSIPFTIDRPYSTQEKIVKALYNVEAGKDLADGAEFTLTGVVTEIVEPFMKGNCSVMMVIDGLTDYPVEAYRAEGYRSGRINVGDTVKITGSLTHYYNKNKDQHIYEFKKGCTVDKVTSSHFAGQSWDWYAYAGAFVSTAGSVDKMVVETPQTYDLHDGAPASDVVGFYGWAALKEGKIAKFAYKIDKGDMVDSPLARLQDAGLDRTAELTNAGIVNGEAFWLVFYYTGLSAGQHTVTFYAIGEDEAVHQLFAYSFTVAAAAEA